MANASVKRLACIPQVLLKALETCNSESVDQRQLVVVCMLDAALSIAILKAAGITRGSVAGNVSIASAVNRLGIATVRQLVIKLLVKQCFMHGKTLSWDQLFPVWRHSMRCAFIARRLAKSSGLVPAEEAYLAGLVHDIGKLVQARPDMDMWAEVEYGPETSGGRSGREKDKLPRRRHPGIGALIVEHTTGNTLLADAVRYHHEAADRIKGAFALVKVVYAANILSQHEGDAVGPDTQLAGDLCGVSQGVLKQLMNRVGGDLDGAMRLLGIKPSAEDGRISVLPTDEKKSLQRCYTEIRHSSLLSASLQSLMQASSEAKAVLGVLADGLKINFGIGKLMFFILDSNHEKLHLCVIGESRWKTSELAISTKEPVKGLVARCASERRLADSFGIYGAYEAAIADEQILHMLGSEGLCCVPLLQENKCLGVVVMGTDRSGVTSLHAQAGLLRQLTISATHCLLRSRQKEKGRQSQGVDELSLLSRRVVHEVNNPLGIIKNYIRLLGLKLPEDHSGRGELNLIIEEVDRISQIINQFATLSRPRVQEKKHINLNRRLEAFLTVLEKSLLQPRQIALHLDLDRHLPPVATDWNALKQVVINLIKNAAEAMHRGGWILVRTRYMPARRVSAKAGSTSPETVEITVKDTGPGIDPDLKARLFKPYVTSKGSVHSGLGLYVVHSIVKALGAKLEFDSHPKQGTAFTVSLPL